MNWKVLVISGILFLGLVVFLASQNDLLLSPSIVSPNEEFLVYDPISLGVYFSQGSEEDEGSQDFEDDFFLSPGIADTCRDFQAHFVSDKIKVRAPLSQGIFFWKDLSERVENLKLELNRRSLAWCRSQECEGGCAERGCFSSNEELFIEPVATNPGFCEDVGKQSIIEISSSSTVSKEGINLIPACVQAQRNVGQDIIPKIRNLLESTCGEDCGYDMDFSDLDYDVDDGSNSCTAYANATVTLTCTDTARFTEYWIWYEKDTIYDCGPIPGHSVV